MSHNVRIDALLRLEACETELLGSPREAKLRLGSSLDPSHFSPRMQITVTTARFTCQRAVVRRRYVTQPVSAPLSDTTNRTAGATSRTKKKQCRKAPPPVGPDPGVRERESGIMVITARQLALIQNRVFRGDYYAFLMTHPLEGKKTDTHIGYSTDWVTEIDKHNTLQINDRTTSTAAPHWRADIVLGPVHCLGKVTAICEDWVDRTRGKKSKREKAHMLARAYNVDIYSCQVKPEQPLGRYLAQKAPRGYLQAYKRLRTPRSER